jgi:hypothetical protein
MLSPLEQSYIDDILALRYPDIDTGEAGDEPVMVAMGSTTGARNAPESVGEFVSDVAEPIVGAGGLLDMAAATAKGAAQGFAGLPGDLEGIARTVMNLLGGSVDEKTALPTTEEIKVWLDKFPISRVGDGTSPYEKIGEFAAPGGYVKGARSVAKGAKRASVAAPAAATSDTGGGK